ncbi:unnamed protein product, partial [Adineta steineri]
VYSAHPCIIKITLASPLLPDTITKPAFSTIGDRSNVSESESVITSNSQQTPTDRSASSSRCFVKKKILWIIIGIIVVILVVTIPTVIIKTKKTNEIKLPTVATEITTQQFTITAKNPTTEEPKFNKWKQDGITVVGWITEKPELYEPSFPEGIYIDKNKNIFFADTMNHRIVEWKQNIKEGQIVAGGNGNGNRMDQLNRPTDVIVDEQNHFIIIADMFNGRVIQWFNQNQQILIHNIACYGLAIDKYGFLYVSDKEKQAVRRWKMGEYNNEGTVVAGGNGVGNQLSLLNSPTFIFVDEDQSVYVTDQANHRVMKWRKGVKEGIVVAGGNGQGGNLNQLFDHRGVIVDDLGQIYVADYGNHRVMRWCEGKAEGEIVVGRNGPGRPPNHLNNPTGLSFDDEGNLYVVDGGANRIQKFEIIL